jgi:hypothetical protein
MQKKRKITDDRREQTREAVRRRRKETLPALGLGEYMVVCPRDQVTQVRAYAARLVAAQSKKRKEDAK